MGASLVMQCTWESACVVADLSSFLSGETEMGGSDLRLFSLMAGVGEEVGG